MRNNLRAYQKVNRDSNLSAADPHTVISMLYDGLIESISISKGAIERKDLALKANSLTKSINILRSLQDSLDKESEPQISENFNTLYSYCIERLGTASVSLETSLLDEVIDLLKPLRDAWKNISQQDKEEGFAKISDRDSARNAASVGA
ncbi:flagellar export chaperone FliS [Endozoicomonas sp. G2_1]|uniref:flagellar export chaperone FliS n=1 Tax=Endozoicomonas sp. G2_1 TaxID=2821091 RepID=UPI001ADB1DB2|nr:flagellar export chaperone FliS [Endozoicomonas sp. G2_1]MBO9489063.1 flagellar export chaperone FliS [Endozoicomonas sp. G2_1]